MVDDGDKEAVFSFFPDLVFSIYVRENAKPGG